MLNWNKNPILFMFLAVVFAASVITGCKDDEKLVYVQSSGSANSVTQHSLITVAGQSSILNTSSFRLELPADSYAAGTEIVVKEDTTFSSLGQAFSSRFIPQSSVLNLSAISKQNANIISSLLFSVVQTDDSYIVNDVGTLTISLLNNSEYKPQDEYFAACKKKTGDWEYLNCAYAGAGQFVINFNVKYSAYVLVKRNGKSVPLITEGMIFKGPSNVIAPNSGVFEDDVEFSLGLGKNDGSPTSFDVSGLKMTFISFDKEAILPFEASSGNALYNIDMQQSGSYFVSLPHQLSMFSSYSDTAGNATYTFKMKLKGQNVASFPEKLLMKASYNDLEVYTAGKVVAFTQLGVPEIYPAVVTVSPASGSINLISDITQFTVKFKEEMVRNSLVGAMVLQEKAPLTGDLGAEIVCGLADYDNTSFTATYICPQLTADREYAATIKSAENIYGHELQAPYSWSFNVRHSGSVSISPANGETGVATDSSVIVTYERAIADRNEVSFELKYADSGNPIGFSVAWTSDTEVTLLPDAAFDYGKTINLSITGGADIDGCVISDVSSSFTTIGRTVISEVLPAENAIQVSPTASIIITFSGSMAASAENSVSLEQRLPTEQNYSPFAAIDKTWLDNNKVLKILPSDSRKWVYNADYRVTVAGSAMDAQNNSIEPKTWSFKIAAGAPPVISVPVISQITKNTANVAFTVDIIDGRPLNISYIGVQVAEYPNNFTAQETAITEFPGTVTGTGLAANISADLSGLKRNTSYWLRVYYKVDSDDTIYYNAADVNNYVKFDTLAWEGAGTVSDPYLVGSAEELIDVKDYLNSYFKQTGNIDLGGITSWVPLGETLATPFVGGYDGDGHEIESMNIVNTNSAIGLGLFGYAQSAEIKGIRLKSATIDAATSSKVGGLVGAASSSTIIDCRVIYGNITGFSSVGGLIGEDIGSEIDNCQVNGDISITANNTTSSDVGGLVGSMHGTTVRNAALGENVRSFSIVGYVNAGGIAGSALSSEISDSSVNNIQIGNSKLDENVGGVAGYMNGGYIDNVSVRSMWVEAGNLVGGFVGTLEDGNLTGTINSCTVVSRDENAQVGILYGRFIGTVSESVTGSSCTVNGIVVTW